MTSCYPIVLTLSPDTSYTLPPEVLSTIFLLVDPHTLYTCIRSLSRHWREAVEDHLLSHQFHSNNWRIALRVSRRFKQNPITSVHHQNGNGNHVNNPIDSLDNLDQDERLEKILNMDGLREDQLDQLDSTGQNNSTDSQLSSTSSTSTSSAFSSKVKSHVIPLKFEKYDSETTSLAFSTGKEWHALFEQPLQSESAEENDDNQGQGQGQGRNDPQDARLDLDFAIVWRFPGDGKDEEDLEEEKASSSNGSKKENATGSISSREREIAREWGNPDPENNWLSRFHCSGYDVSPVVSNPSSRLASPNSSEISTPSRRLLSTPLARRTRTKPETASNKPRIQRTAILRRAELNPESSGNNEGEEDESETCHCHEDEEEDEIDGVNNLIWSDKGHEYINLNLNLGIEFFVRRSAKANLLHRKLEEEAMRRFQEDEEDEDDHQVEVGNKSRGEISIASSSASSEFDEDESFERKQDELKMEGLSLDEKKSTTSSGNGSNRNVTASAWKKPWLTNEEKSNPSLGSEKKINNSNLNPDPYAHLPFIHRPKASRTNGGKSSGKSSRFNSPRNSSPLSGLSRSNSQQKNLSSLGNDDHINSTLSSPPSSRNSQNQSQNISRSPTPNLDSNPNLNKKSFTSNLNSQKRILFHDLKQASNNHGKLIASSLPATPSFRSSLKNSSPSKIESNLNKTTEALMLSNLNSNRLRLPTPAQSNLAAKQLAQSQSQSLNPTRPSSRSGFRSTHGDSLDLDRITRSTNGTPRARFVGRLYRAEDLLSPANGCLTPNNDSTKSRSKSSKGGAGKCEKCLAKKMNANGSGGEGLGFPNGGAWDPDPEEMKNKPDRKGWIGGDSLGRNQVRMAFDQDDLEVLNDAGEEKGEGEGMTSKAYIWEWSR